MTLTLSSSQNSRIEALRNKHAVLSNQIEKAQNNLGTADFYLTQLKKQKLVVKEEIHALREKRNQRVA